MAKGNAVETSYTSYLATAFPGVTLTPDQAREVKRGFYAGAWAMYHLMTGITGQQGIARPIRANDLADRVLQLRALEAEMRDYLKAVEDGRA